MKSYTAWTKREKVTVFANNVDEARLKVTDILKCPLRSIEFCGLTPTKKGIKQAKAWGY
mgnify:CR=1 FL=1